MWWKRHSLLQPALVPVFTDQALFYKTPAALVREFR
jgi:hypothetical protein